MFYFVAKIVWFFATPSNLIAFLVLGGLVLLAMRWRRFGGALVALGLIGLFLCGLGPIGTMLIVPLEYRFPRPSPDAPAPQGIIVLGGAIEDRISAVPGRTIEVNEAGDRIIALVELARRYPDARLVFSGGAGDFAGASEVPEAEVLRRMIGLLGIDPARVTFENQSRNTAENARLTAALVQPGSGPWWLVTSAFHMPRAVGAFRAARFPVVAYPVDYRTAASGDTVRLFATVGEGLRRTDVAAKEWIGLLGYRMTGRTAAILPAP